MTKILLTGGCVLTLGARSSNLARGDVLIEDELIAEVGPTIRARDAEQIDAADTIVMPGFVDAHRHAWTSLFRNLGESDPRSTLSAPAWAMGDRSHSEDVYAATLVGLLGAAEAGITTVVDWCDLPAGEGLVEAALRAHAESGLRTDFVYVPSTGGLDSALVARLVESAGPTTTIAFGAPLPDAGGSDAGSAWATARELGLRIHAHAAGTERGVVAELGRRGLLGEDVTLLHCSDLVDADVEAILKSGASICLAPSSEMADGLGAPPIQPLIDRDVRFGLGVDAERLTPGDLFAQMRATISVQHATVFDLKLAGKAGLPKLMSTRDVIRHASIEGARAVGLGRLTGSLEPGKRADLVVLRTDRPNVFPINDPIGAVVWGMDTSNVDSLFVDGRPLMRDGLLTADVERARGLAVAARERISTTPGPRSDSVPEGVA